MSADLGSLSAAAFTIGLVHCICGPDHYVPFVAMSRVGLWSLRKTVLVTFVCGVGHIAGSALLGFIGIALGLIVFQLEAAEQIRGDLAGWLLTIFGGLYFLWGLVHAVRTRRVQRAGDSSSLEQAEQKTAETMEAGTKSLTPWILFVVFLFGPCEPLIPLLMYPAAKANMWNVIWVTAIFGLTTLVTMVTLVTMIYLGTFAIRFERTQVYGHALAGFIVLSCGLAIMLGL